MKLLKKIFDFYIEASIHVALALTSLTLATGVLLNITISLELISFIFLGGVAGYNFIKYDTGLLRWRSLDVNHGLLILLLTLTAGLGALFCLQSLPSITWGLLAFLMVVILMYMFPLAQRNRNLRSLGIVKVILVAVSWTAVTVYLPVLCDAIVIDWDLNVFGLQRFLLVVSLIIPFEIRDMSYDPEGIRTIPRRIGVRATKKLGILLMILASLLLFLRDDIDILEIVARGLMMIFVSLLIWKTPEKGSKYYASFWVEAMPIFWYLGILLLQTQI